MAIWLTEFTFRNLNGFLAEVAGKRQYEARSELGKKS